MLLLVALSALGAERWESPRVPITAPFPGTTGLSAASCGQCHAQIYAEWQSSTHAHAWVDPQYQQELAKDPEVAWLCINCHIPLAGQQPQLTRSTGDLRHPERRPNPTWDESLQQEGITCLSCHWRQEGIASAHPDTQAPHPTVYSPELLDERLCTSCHQAVSRLEDTLVCTFNTGKEWEQANPGEPCQGCHMPRIQRAAAAGAPVREGGRHTFPGSLIPKAPLTADQQAMVADWLPGATGQLQAPAQARVGDAVSITATYKNERAGHMLPTGDPERYLLITAQATDAQDQPLAQAQARVGQVWEWWPVAKRLSDNRLAAGEARVLQLDFTMPADAVQIVLTIDSYRISPENAAYHKLTDYPTHRRLLTRTATVAVSTD